MLEDSNDISATIWVVDDESSIRMLMCEALLRDSFKVRDFSSGEALLQAIGENSPTHLPDMIIMDVVMPVMNGYQLCRQLRSRPAGKDLLVLMVTGLDDETAIDQAFDSGATDFLLKPLNWGVFHHRLRFILRTATVLKALKKSQSRLQRTEEIAKVGYLDWDIKQKHMHASEQVYKMFGVESQSPELFYKTFHQGIHEDDRINAKIAITSSIATGMDLNVGFRVVDNDDHVRHVQLQGKVHRSLDGSVDYIFATLNDTSDHKKYEQLISRLAYYDEVTGIPNRSLFKEHLKLALLQAERTKATLAVLFLDLDKFKRINDTLGHQAGDQLLKIVAGRLNGTVRSSDVTSRIDDVSGSTVARLGGDEFTILLSDLTQIDDVNLVVKRIQSAMSEPMMLEDQQIYITCSIGIATYPSDSRDAQELLKHADTAMYYSKQHGRNCCFMYGDISFQENNQTLEMEHELHHALKNGELQLYYQPKIELSSNKIAGFEALIRWIHPVKGLIPPNDFIPMAENSGLILPIGEWVLLQACRQIKRWEAMGFGLINVAVNFSEHQLEQDNASKVVSHILTEQCVDPICLNIELTESTLVQDIDHAIRQLTELHALGISLSIDDFGTGYSSMSYLRDLPMDTLKIDRAFIINICHSHKDASIVKSIITLARNLNMKVVAEGIESDDQLSLLGQYQCHQVQGFVFSKPLPASDVTALIHKHGLVELGEHEVISA